MKYDQLPVYILNQPHQTSRLRHCVNQLTPFFKDIRVFPSYDADYAKQHRHEFFTYEVFENIERRFHSELVHPTWSSAACAISHYQLWCTLSKMETNDPVLVVEDDFEIIDSEKFQFAVQECLHLFHRLVVNDNPQRRLLLFQLDGFRRSMTIFPSHDDWKRKQLQLISSMSLPNGGDVLYIHAYLIHPMMCRFLISRFLPMTYQMDLQISRFSDMYRSDVDYFHIVYHQAGTKQSVKFDSTTQYQYLTPTRLSSLLSIYLPQEICKNIVNFLPQRLETESYLYTTTEI